MDAMQVSAIPLGGFYWSCKPLDLSHDYNAQLQGSPLSPTSTQDVSDRHILPRGSRVLIVGNQRTKKALVGEDAVVIKAIGLGGWTYCKVMARLGGNGRQPATVGDHTA